jgi:hypothetical protein
MQSLGQISEVRGGEVGSMGAPIAPARGIAVALALGGVGWAAILGLVMLVRSWLGA